MTKSVTACPLDCYDACKIIYENKKIKPFKDGYTQGFLCPHLNHYSKYKPISVPKYKGIKLSMQEALEKLVEILESSDSDKVLHYRGSGNFALMQEATDHFFASFGSVLTDGTLCDGAGEAGIIKGRGSNKNMPPSEIEKSDIVIIWGRNPHSTSSHLLPLIKDKTIIVIDPIRTKIAKISDIHIQLKPHCDIYLAMILTHFLHKNRNSNTEYLNKRTKNFEEYAQLIKSVSEKTLFEDIGLTLNEVERVLALLIGKKVAIVCGVGIQKYSNGTDVMRAIDAFALTLGLFGKEGCGVSYLGNSKEGINSPFNTKAKRVSKVDTDFSKFKSVFIQGANPLSQMPDSLRVKESLSKVENLIYFGLYENETSAAADLIIPAKSFLFKNDIRTSYSHHGMMCMSAVDETQCGISEYDLSSYLCSKFNIELKREDFYLEFFQSFSTKSMGEEAVVKVRENRPYKTVFDTVDGKFLLLKECKPYKAKKEQFYLITSKSAKSLNSQFKREESVYLHSSLGFKEGSRVIISSVNGTITLRVKINDDIREDCVLIYSGTEGVNKLTSSKHSREGKSAIFQEVGVDLILKG